MKQIFFSFVNLPIIYFGIVAAVTALISTAGAYYSHELSEKFGEKFTFIFAKLGSAILILSAALLLGNISILLLMLTSVLYAIAEPIEGHMLNRNIESRNRGTVLSIINLMKQFGYVVFAPLIGHFADLYTIATSFKISGIALILTSTFLFFIKDTKKVK